MMLCGPRELDTVWTNKTGHCVNQEKMAVDRTTEHDTAWNTRTRHTVDQQYTIVHEVIDLSIQTVYLTHLFESTALCSYLFIKFIISHEMDVFDAVGSRDRNVRSSRLQLINLQLTLLVTQAIQKQNTIAFCQNLKEYQYTIHASSACLSACCSLP
jgi:hypothetical protein